MLNRRNWESAMWKCIYCQRDVKFKAIQLEFDNDGFYFICPDSQGRNPLDNASKPRSTEHTSELQSLMRISYAVFCLKIHSYYSSTGVISCWFTWYARYARKR